jgi:tetratricopeptide (TPR) repeat protein
VATYQRLVAAEPLNEGFRGTLAWLYFLSGKFEEGINIWRPLIAQGRGGIWGIVLYAHQDRFNEAIDAGERHLRNAPPDHPEFWVYLGNAYQGAGQHENALRTWAEGARQLEAKFSISDDSHSGCSLGILYAALAQRQKALNVVAKTSNRNPLQASFCASLVYAKLGDNTEAIRQLDRAAQFNNYMLYFIDMYARPDGPFYRLHDHPQFVALRSRLLHRIEDIRRKL